MAKLLVNVDHVASMRELRRARVPDPILAAAAAEMAGADGISAHLRGDRRHVKEHDLEMLSQTVKTRLNVEIAPTQEMVKIALQIKPYQVTLLPERPDEITTEGGLDILRNRDNLAKAVQSLRDGDIQRVALFVEPDVEQVKAAHRLDVNVVELNTSRYADARVQVARAHNDPYLAFSSLANAAKFASKLNLTIAAGVGLDYHNVKDLREQIREIDEFCVGFAVIARALVVGVDRAVRDMVELVR